jgi:prepilin-type N-terminal cleavage/methylation domain-containing protein
MMENNRAPNQSVLDERGVTLIELLVVLVICAIVVGGIYKVFITQTKAYTLQDQVVEVQQDVRAAMELMVRDIRMAGFQTNNFGNAAISSNAIVIYPNTSSHITVNYEHINPLDPTCQNPNDCVTYQVDYQLVTAVSSACPNPPCLQHTCTPNPAVPPVPQCSGTPDILLTNVTNLDFTYGIDANGDGIIDGINMKTGLIPDNPYSAPGSYHNQFVLAANVGTAKILAVHIQLQAAPTSTDPDVTKMVSPRTLNTAVTPRNIFFNRFQSY